MTLRIYLTAGGVREEEVSAWRVVGDELTFDVGKQTLRVHLRDVLHWRVDGGLRQWAATDRR